MSTQIKKHPLAIAWDEWIASDEGQKCRDVSTVKSDHYLQNRLHYAFRAGAANLLPVVEAAIAWHHGTYGENDSDLAEAVDTYERETT